MANPVFHPFYQNPKEQWQLRGESSATAIEPSDLLQMLFFDARDNQFDL